LREIETVKHDDGKTRWDLLPWDELADLADVFAFGAEKYGVDNWRKGLSWWRLFRAMIGHAIEHRIGHTRNAQDGNVYHLAQVAWNALVLLHYEKNGIGTDDRPKRP